MQTENIEHKPRSVCNGGKICFGAQMKQQLKHVI